MRFVRFDRLGWPGNDLLSQALRHSTIGAEVFDGRVRDGIGSGHLAKVTRPAKPIGARLSPDGEDGASAWPDLGGGVDQRTGSKLVGPWPRLLGAIGLG